MNVSALCDHCYAQTLDKRYGGSNWGLEGRRRFIKSVWNDLPKWNQEAKQSGIRKRVFVMSMGDFFEDLPKGHPDREHMITTRLKAMHKMDTEWTSLDFLVLTKRISNVQKMVPRRWMDKWPGHVRIGISVGTQPDADRDIPRLLKLPCPNFLSMEPLLEKVSLFGDALDGGDTYGPALKVRGYRCNGPMDPEEWDVDIEIGIDWIIVGGESGPHARPSHPDWFRSLRDECEAAGVPFHFKQWGEDRPANDGKETAGRPLRAQYVSIDGKRSQERLPPPAALMVRVGKKAAGRLLDGRTHDEFPQVTTL